MPSLSLILGNHLFPKHFFKEFPHSAFMCEDMNLCTHFKYHQHKIAHFFISMRNFKDEWESQSKKVHYFKLEENPHFFQKLNATIKSEKIETVHSFEVEDVFFEKKLREFFQKIKVNWKVHASPMFLVKRDEFSQWLGGQKRPLMQNFYVFQRKKRRILIKANGKPLGDKWSLDEENRKKIPKNFVPLDFRPKHLQNQNTLEVFKLIKKYFPDHPGDETDFWPPCTRKDALSHLKQFLEERFENFGQYQDALDQRSPFLYHSLISPLINIGLLTPDEVINEALKFEGKVPLNSLEGFIRQVLGWREFLRGTYQNFPSLQESSQANFFKHTKKLSAVWYQGNSGITPLDNVVKKVIKYGYAHHIERLMVLSNLMLLVRINPQEVFKWFMEMFVDSSDWVMGPNVYGMGQFADGGVFASKPYFSGSNYILKMGNYSKKEFWVEGWNGLYWNFIRDHQDFFAQNHRMSFMVKTYQKFDQEKKTTLDKKAKELTDILTL